MISDSVPDRIRGAVFGVAAGDALGAPVEFESREALQGDPVKGMRGYGTHNQPVGTWSDDTSMALCLLEGLVERKSWNEIADLFQKWLDHNYWTPHGEVYDAGNITRQAIALYPKHDDRRNAGLAGQFDNGNGSLMRTLPIALMFKDADRGELAKKAHYASRLTHGHPRSQMACGIYCDFARRLLGGADKELAWEGSRGWAKDYYSRVFPEEVKEYRRILDRDVPAYCETPNASIKSSGYVVDTLDAGIWSFLTTQSFADCCLTAVNLGDDTDTTGAVAGGLAGVYYGYKAIPEEWLKVLARRADIESLIERAIQKVREHK
ncbi:MAG: ADP-ribosylglycohydrolase family protein [Candidatus Sumerlaeaceae bacterium]|nr:ADP-ribosylglycohydrolase family protein [Candidatus Sumerlaeaceae bacterium]